MIKSENGALDITGNRVDLLLEFMHLYEGMIEEVPTADRLVKAVNKAKEELE